VSREFDGNVANRIEPPNAYGNFPTMAAWINLDTGPNQFVCGKWDTGAFAGNGQNAQLVINGSQKVLFAVNVPPILTVTGATTVTLSGWHHVAGSYDGFTLRAYLDGAIDGSTSPGAGFTTNLAATWRIGVNKGEAAAFDGKIADVGFWERALLPAEVASLAGGTSPSRITHGLLSHCPLWGVDNPELDLRLGSATIQGTVPGSQDHPFVGSPWSAAG
jgi:hypothetical protein